MKTTKEIIIKTLGYDEKEFDRDYNPNDRNLNDKWYSESDIKQLQKELLENYSYVRCNECGRDSIHVESVIKVFDNFKEK